MTCYEKTEQYNVLPDRELEEFDESNFEEDLELEAYKKYRQNIGKPMDEVDLYIAISQGY